MSAGVFPRKGNLTQKVDQGKLSNLSWFCSHRPERHHISGNCKRTPSAKFETMISEPRPKQRK